MFASSFENDTVVMPANVENVVLESDDWGCLFPSSLAVEGNDLNNRIVGNETRQRTQGRGRKRYPLWRPQRFFWGARA